VTRYSTSRSLHDLGLAAWFGGTLANAVALNAASSATTSDRDAGRVANAGWDRWTPVNAAAIGLHLTGAVIQLRQDRRRVAAQTGAGSVALTKTVLTAAALGVTAYSRVLGRTVSQHRDVPVASATEPLAHTPPEVAQAQQRLAALQWVVPALTGALVVVSSVAGEQQRPSEVKRGIAARLAR